LNVLRDRLPEGLPMELARLIESLTDPAAYPYSVKAVEVRQTHISVVFLAGPYVYKVKKPVDFGFLDFSTLEKRHHFCAEEVRLNRRLAPDVYLDVVPIVRAGVGLKLEGPGEAVEWAVKMQRLPDEATLLEWLRRGEVGPELAETLAHRIVSFHRTAAETPVPESFGRFDAVARNLRDIFTQSEPQVGNTVSCPVFNRLRALTEESLERLRPLIESRAHHGMTRDTHGDLHLDHVYYFPDRQQPNDLVIIDCIEFTERFRYADPVADMAFPYMDFLFHGRRDLARMFADAYFAASGDEEGRRLLPLYTAYRASVRGSVEGLKLAEKEISATDRRADLQKARAHWLLALGQLEEPGRRPCLLLVTGLPGTGKSTLARALAERSNFEVVRSDVVRKELAGLVPHELTPPEARAHLYSADWNDRTYAECLRQAEELLFQGKRVLVDATFREEARRRTFLEAAVRWGVPGALIVCEAKTDTIRERLAGRRHDASDADWLVYLQTVECWEEPSSFTLRVLRKISTDGGPRDAVEQTCELLRELQLHKFLVQERKCHGARPVVIG
jgi:aminoglycoside phosphotransferase family enzyme/predicted kinase